MGLLRPRGEEVNPRFLLYAYLGPQFQAEIQRRAVHGATVDRIPLDELAEWPVSIPDHVTQDAIAEVLGALDDKVERNRNVAWLAERLSVAQCIVATGQVPVEALADVERKQLPVESFAE